MTQLERLLAAANSVGRMEMLADLMDELPRLSYILARDEIWLARSELVDAMKKVAARASAVADVALDSDSLKGKVLTLPKPKGRS